MVDVIVISYVVDGKQQDIVYDIGKCYCHGGRWNDHLGGLHLADIKAMVADGITTGQHFFI